MYTAIAWLLIAALPAPPPDTLVVCPDRLRSALAPWESFRSAEGHVLSIVEPSKTFAGQSDVIRQAANHGSLKYVVLVGDVSDIPTGYIDAKVNVHWGSEPAIATDQLYADIDGDGTSDVAVGRIPADSSAELIGFVRKVLQYEQNADDGSWRRQLNVVAGVGGFGPLTDALIEAAGRSVFQQIVPPDYHVDRLPADPDATCDQISTGSLAWIYLGHGLPSMLDVVSTPRGEQPILSVGDVPRLRCGASSPLAVLVACYTGAIDARSDCLAEELALNPQGPVAVIGATRVTMPYGNAVLGSELLRSALVDRSGTLGHAWMLAQQHALAPTSAGDSLRTSLDALAQAVSPPPVDLAGERREHVLMYQLLGDPLLRLKYPPAEPQAAAQISAVRNEPSDSRQR